MSILLRQFYFFISILLFFSSCKKEKIKADFYYWKSVYQLDNITQKMLHETNATRLYVKYFDVVWKNGVVQPASTIHFQSVMDTSLQIIPVIYIQNQVFSNLKDTGVTQLVNHIASLIDQINHSNNLKIKTLQFDCDWTLETRDNYFHFLELVQKKIRIPLSATIRLHQIKYASKTGIPPVDKGVLMYYNMGKITTDRRNSIYDRAIGLKYIPYLASYNLPLDIALPIFHWGVQMRDNKVVNVIGRLGNEQLASEKAFSIKNNQIFQCDKAGFYFGRYWRKLDSVKVENITGRNLSEMIADLDKYLHKDDRHYIFYDLDNNNANLLNQYLFNK